MDRIAAHTEMFVNRCRKTHARLAPRFRQEQVEVWRLYDRDIPEIRLVVDVVGDALVVGEYERRQTVPGEREALGAALAAALGVAPDRVFGRARRTRPAEGARYGRLAQESVRAVVREGALRFHVNLTDYLDIGLFADHRLTRRAVMAESAGRRVLNLFCYTGSFTAYAAAGGAVATTSVDGNPRYLGWARENLELNGLFGPAHEGVASDVRPFLARAAAAGRRWDLIVLDPPSFSEVPGMVPFEVQADHRHLIERCLAVLAPGGVLWFSTNHQRFEPELDGLPVAAAEERTAALLPPDFAGRTPHRVWRLQA